MYEENGSTVRDQFLAEIARLDEERVRIQRVQQALTPAVRRALLEFARLRERMVVGAGGRGAVGEAADWVADAIADTMTGAVTWPDGIALAAHLGAVIRGRTATLARVAKERPHVSLDAARSGAERAALVAQMGTAPSAAGAHEARSELARVVAFVEAMEPDAAVVALLSGYRAGASDTAEAGRVAGLTRAQTTAARRRLDRLLARMARWDECETLSDSGSC